MHGVRMLTTSDRMWLQARNIHSTDLQTRHRTHFTQRFLYVQHAGPATTHTHRLAAWLMAHAATAALKRTSGAIVSAMRLPHHEIGRTTEAGAYLDIMPVD
jgi:hypothetical protein